MSTEMEITPAWCQFNRVFSITFASINANFLEQKKAFAYEKSSALRGLVWDTNMAAVTSCENTL